MIILLFITNQNEPTLSHPIHCHIQRNKLATPCVHPGPPHPDHPPLLCVKQFKRYEIKSKISKSQRRPLVRPTALPSSGRCALFFYCRPQPESQDPGESSSPSPPPQGGRAGGREGGAPCHPPPTTSNPPRVGLPHLPPSHTISTSVRDQSANS